MDSSTADYRVVSNKEEIALEDFTRLMCDLGGLLQDPLGDRVDVLRYSRKLHERAELVVAISNGEAQVATAAFYANDVVAKHSYLSFLAVRREYWGRGIGPTLLERMFEILEEKGFVEVSCHVHRDDVKAIRMYSRCGFSLISEDDRGFLMSAPVGGTRRRLSQAR